MIMCLHGLAWQRRICAKSICRCYCGPPCTPPQDLFAKFIVSLQTGGYRKFYQLFKLSWKACFWTPCYRPTGIYQKKIHVRSSLDEKSFFLDISYSISWTGRGLGWEGGHPPMGHSFVFTNQVSSFRQMDEAFTQAPTSKLFTGQIAFLFPIPCSWYYSLLSQKRGLR